MQTPKKLLLFGIWVALVIIFLSCNDKDEINLTPSDTAIVQTEAEADAYFEDADNLVLTAMVSDNATTTGGKTGSGGRRIEISDLRFGCAVVEIVMDESSTFQVPKGSITIDFGDGCEGPGGNVREGKVLVAFEGRRFLPGSTIVTTFENYKINGVRIEGTRTVSNVAGSNEASPKFNILVENGKATWPDATFALREANFTREWVRRDNPVNDEWRVTGSATGTNRNGNTYIMEILEALIYKTECAVDNRIFMAVQGVKVLNSGDRQLKLDYGTGECDRIVTVISNGESTEVEVD